LKVSVVGVVRVVRVVRKLKQAGRQNVKDKT